MDKKTSRGVSVALAETGRREVDAYGRINSDNRRFS